MAARPGRTRQRWGALCCTLALALSLGCVSESRKSPRGSGPEPGRGGITEINLLAIPVALNFDGAPGPDGFMIKIYAGNRKQPKPLLIEEGKVDVMMFDGIPRGGTPPEPRRVWTYSAAELRPFEIRSSIGVGYQLALSWGDAKPTSSSISVVVRYATPKGATVFSAPSVISVALK